MKIKQLRGPFNKDNKLYSKEYPGGGIVHVGVQVPYRTPARFIESDHVIELEKEEELKDNLNSFKTGQIIKVNQQNTDEYKYYKIFTKYGEVVYDEEKLIDSLPEQTPEIDAKNYGKIFIKEINEDSITFGYITSIPHDDSDSEITSYSFITNSEINIEGLTEPGALYQNDKNEMILLIKNGDNQIVFTDSENIDEKKKTYTITPQKFNKEIIYDKEKSYYTFDGYVNEDDEEPVIKNATIVTPGNFELSKVDITEYKMELSTEGIPCKQVTIKQDEDNGNDYKSEFSFELISDNEEETVVKDGNEYFKVKEQQYSSSPVKDTVAKGEYSVLDEGFSNTDDLWGNGSSYRIWNETDNNKTYPSLILHKNNDDDNDSERYNLSYASLEISDGARERFYKSIEDLPKSNSSESYKIALTRTPNEGSKIPYLTSLQDVQKDVISIGEDINIATITRDKRGPFYIIPTNGYTVGSTVKDYLKNDTYTQALLDWMNKNENNVLMDAPIVVVDKKYDANLLGVAELVQGYQATMRHLDTENCYKVWHDVEGYSTDYTQGAGGFVVANTYEDGETGDKIFYNTTFDERKKLENFLNGHGRYGKIKIILRQADDKIKNEITGKDDGYYTFICSSSENDYGFYLQTKNDGKWSKEVPIEGQVLNEKEGNDKDGFIWNDFKTSEPIEKLLKELKKYGYVNEENGKYYIKDNNSLQHSEINGVYQYKRLKLNNDTVCVFRLTPSTKEWTNPVKKLTKKGIIEAVGKEFFYNDDRVCLCYKKGDYNYLNVEDDENNKSNWYTVKTENSGKISQKIYIREVNHFDKYEGLSRDGEKIISQKVECLLKISLNEEDMLSDIQLVEDNSVLKSIKQEVENKLEWYEKNEFSVKILNHYEEVQQYLKKLANDNTLKTPEYIYVKDLDVFYKPSVKRRYIFKPLKTLDRHPNSVFEPDEKDFHLWYVYDTSDPLLKNSLSLYLSNEEWTKYKNCKLVAKTSLNATYSPGTTTIPANSVEDMYKRMLAAYALQKMNIMTDYTGNNLYDNYWLYNYSSVDSDNENIIFKDCFTGDTDTYFSLVKKWQEQDDSKNDVVLIEEGKNEYHLYKKEIDKKGGDYFSYTKIYDFPTNENGNLKDPYDSLVQSPIGYETYQDMISDIEWHKTLYNDKNGNYSKFFYVYADKNILKRGTYKLENVTYKLVPLNKIIRFSNLKKDLPLSNDESKDITYVWTENDNSIESFYVSESNVNNIKENRLESPIIKDIPVIEGKILYDQNLIDMEDKNEIGNESFVVLKDENLAPKLFYVMNKKSTKYIKGEKIEPQSINESYIKIEDKDNLIMVIEKGIAKSGTYILKDDTLYLVLEENETNNISYYVPLNESKFTWTKSAKNSYNEEDGTIDINGQKNISFKGNELNISFDKSLKWSKPYVCGNSNENGTNHFIYSYEDGNVVLKKWDSSESKFEIAEEPPNNFTIKESGSQKYMVQSPTGTNISNVSKIWNNIQEPINEKPSSSFYAITKNEDDSKLSLWYVNKTLSQQNFAEEVPEIKDYVPTDDKDIKIMIQSGSASKRELKEVDIRLSERNILEFENLNDSEWTLIALRDLPRETLIDIGYEELFTTGSTNVIGGNTGDANEDGTLGGDIDENDETNLGKDISNMADIRHWEFGW